jgi:hypothetical protein
MTDSSHGLTSDDDSYYEEEIIEDDEITIETVVDEHGFPVHANDDDEASGELLLDDDSSTPPPSLEGHPSSDTRGWFDSFASFDALVDEAAQKGAMMASQEALAREEYLQRLAAREALQRKCREQQEKHFSPSQSEHGRRLLHRYQLPSQEESAAMELLLERLEQVEGAMDPQSPTRTTANIKILGAASLEKRKQALGELRRLAARNQLVRNVDELKAVKTTTA